MKSIRNLLLFFAFTLLVSSMTLPTVSLRPAIDNSSEKPVDDMLGRIVQRVKTTIDLATEALLLIGRLSYSFMVFLGTFLYMTSLNKRLGRDLVVGGIGLVLFFEILEPVLF
ncbi:MAG: hypothetical protein JSW01_05895 [Candidatus Bathyarchaeota archaeon]|nr:MAG: hypothetical protein JSW01_05895 [Candidatus Bathyarchaeota archaeon]